MCTGDHGENPIRSPSGQENMISRQQIHEIMGCFRKPVPPRITDKALEAELALARKKAEEEKALAIRRAEEALAAQETLAILWATEAARAKQYLETMRETEAMHAAGAWKYKRAQWEAEQARKRLEQKTARVEKARGDLAYRRKKEALEAQETLTLLWAEETARLKQHLESMREIESDHAADIWICRREQWESKQERLAQESWQRQTIIEHGLLPALRARQATVTKETLETMRAAEAKKAIAYWESSRAEWEAAQEPLADKTETATETEPELQPAREPEEIRYVTRDKLSGYHKPSQKEAAPVRSRYAAMVAGERFLYGTLIVFLAAIFLLAVYSGRDSVITLSGMFTGAGMVVLCWRIAKTIQLKHRVRKGNYKVTECRAEHIMGADKGESTSLVYIRDRQGRVCTEPFIMKAADVKKVKKNPDAVLLAAKCCWKGRTNFAITVRT